MIGRIYTYKVSETQEVVENVHPSYLQWNLDRLLVGGEQCDPYTDDDQTTPLVQGSSAVTIFYIL